MSSYEALQFISMLNQRSFIVNFTKKRYEHLEQIFVTIQTWIQFNFAE